MNGKLITFEGIDGCGKSTQAKKLYTKLSSINRISVLTREPGGSPGAEEIRHLLVKGEVTRWSAETEILLFTAARRDHLERTILPAIKEGKIVISDRFFDSTRIYQGAARSDLINIVDQLHKLVIDIVPDLTFIIDMEPKIALKRGLARKSGEDRFEEFGEPFQEKIRHGFINLAMKEKERCFLIDGAQDQEIIADEIFAICSKNFNG
jgi:dTMP kinase